MATLASEQNNSEKTKKFFMKLIPGEFRGTHISIFPKKEASSVNSRAENSYSFQISDGKRIYVVPHNFSFYMQPREERKYQWCPPKELLDILRGNKSIILSGNIPTSLKEEYIGWIDYAHPNGISYSITNSGIFNNIIEKSVPFSDTLIDGCIAAKMSKAKSCEGFNKLQLDEMEKLQLRALFLSELAGWRVKHDNKTISNFIKQNESDLIKRRGEGNYITNITDTICFPKINPTF